MLKRLAIALGLSLLLTSIVPIVLSRPQAAPPILAGCPLQPADNIWNVPVDTLPLDANSAAYINTIGRSTGLHPDFGANWGGGPFGIPYLIVPSNQPLVSINFTAYGDESDPGPYPIPLNAPIEGGANSDGDRHVLVLRQGECKLYELYRAFPVGAGWAADSGAVFDFKSNGLRPDTWTSADAAGLPILPGLVTYDEVASGEIKHALRFTANLTQKKHVWPARHDASSSTNPARPPMGQRFRLKASVDISNYPAPVQVIFRAFKTYGLILADNGSNWYISGAPDARWDDDILVSAFRTLTGDDFEAVDVSSLMVDPNSGQALSDFTLTASPTGRAIDAGSVTMYQLRFEKSAAFTSAITVTAGNPSPSLTLKLSNAIVTPPITITLTITDSHPIGSPPLVYAIPITATGGSVTHYASVRVLINGLKVFLPITRKN
jgi:hypothetical protein